QNRTVGFIENGSWAPMAAKVMKDKLSSQKNLTFIEQEVKIVSSLSEENLSQIDALAQSLLSK
ncbi:MAG: FprA family A-type flavoprotein, partial [Christensenellales bacterium]